MKCPLCQEPVDFLPSHLDAQHGVKESDMKLPSKYMSKRLENLLYEEAPERSLPNFGDLKVQLGPVTFPVNADVPAEACLPMPHKYVLPVDGQLGRAVRLTTARVATLARTGGSIMVHGSPGCGKDAFFHYWCAATRTPSFVLSFAQADVARWFFFREINEKGSYWADGALIHAIRDGYAVKDAQGNVVRTIPYAILFSDLDRATPEQAEILRLMLDSIEPRVLSPRGDTIKVFPGTLFFATSNTAGSGDHTGRYVSAQVLDATIIDRVSAIFKFCPLTWADELVILERSYAPFFRTYPEFLKNLGIAFTLIRKAIDGDEILGDFSHRAVVRVIEQAKALYEFNASDNVFVDAFEVFFASLSSEVEGTAIRRILDPKIPGFLPKKKAETNKTNMT